MIALMADVSRYDTLDALRGLAAFSVVVHHGAMVLPWAPVLAGTPMLAGHEAVIFFFVLSGFVLSLAFQPGAPVPYGPFLIKRVCRIYLPYLVSVLVAAAACAWLARGPMPELSVWFNLSWPPLDAKGLVDHVLFVRSFQNNTLNPVIWSLVHEMRISLVFPLLMAVVLRWRWQAVLGLGLALSIASTGLGTLAQARLGYRIDYFETMHYTLMFLAGALLARHGQALAAHYRRLAPAGRAALVAVAVALYFGSQAVQGSLAGRHWIFESLLSPLVINDWLILAGVAIGMVAVTGSARAERLLSRPPLLWLGRVSYSLYLYHALVMLALIHGLSGRLPLPAILAISLALSLVTAALGHRLVEQPAMALGRRCGGRKAPPPVTPDAEAAPRPAA